MQTKLIKLSDTHYIVVDDSEIKDVRPHKGKWHYEEGVAINQFPTYLTDLSACKLITHSTEPLEPSLKSDNHDAKGFVFIKPLSLSEVEEAIKSLFPKTEWNIKFDEQGNSKSVKLADLIDNTKSIIEHDKNFARTYMKEKEELLFVLEDGDQRLMQMAIKSLREARKLL